MSILSETNDERFNQAMDMNMCIHSRNLQRLRNALLAQMVYQRRHDDSHAFANR